ncbi:sigma-70 family RNA polymerase sigma factor [Dactylosporangium sp. NPDC005572]|uniref:RNA polymerase sigma factor n=1 Tax=Dactylosporangium sp. NPDC005572 TaxID=3156889 RepID=UPI0033AFBF12
MDDDLRIRDGLLAGREDALAEAYDTHAAAVYGIALHLTRDSGVAEDIVQDVFVDLWLRPERYDPGRSRLRGWLCMISRRRAIDWLRRRRTQELHRHALAESGVVLPYVEDEVMTSLAHKQVRKAVNELPFTHRQAIVLAYYHGLTYREVGVALGIPEGTAKYRLSSALRRIAEQVAAFT